MLEFSESEADCSEVWLTTEIKWGNGVVVHFKKLINEKIDEYQCGQETYEVY